MSPPGAHGEALPLQPLEVKLLTPDPARTGATLAAVMILGILPHDGAAQAVSTVDSRDDAAAIIEELDRIDPREGIQVLERVELGGAPQWVSIRGKDRDNPVIVFIPGGWGDPMIGLSWAFQRPWEDYFTVVQWEQRGSGKSAVDADRDRLREEFTVERLTSDAEELIEYVRHELGKDKVVVMAWSLGGLIGARLAKRHPEWIHAYVGIGQVSYDLERALYDHTVALAKVRGNQEALSELEPYAAYPDSIPIGGAGPWVTRRWAQQFDGGLYGKRDWSLFANLPVLSPEYTMKEALAAWDMQGWMGDEVFRPGRYDLRRIGPGFEIPLIFFHGRHDATPPLSNVREYFDWVEAPSKKLVVFERSAHAPYVEEPGRFLAALLEHVLPLTEGPADHGPGDGLEEE